MTVATAKADDKVFSIVVCTHNRPASAARLIAELVRQIRPLPVELIVVDSASNPPNRRALAETLVNFSEVRLVQMEEKGVSLARNAGLNAARAQWVAFIDDDEMPDPDWTVEALALIQRLPENCAACGGVVRPDLTLKASSENCDDIGPRWRAYLGEMIREGEFDQTDNPQFGIGHSVVRVSAIQQIGGFNLSLGRDGVSLLSGEEVLLVIQLNAHGWRIWHSSRIAVTHEIESDRLERHWARDRAYWEGVSTARIQMITRSFELRSVFIVVFKTMLLFMALPFGKAHQELDLRAAFNRGFIVEGIRSLVKRRHGSMKLAIGFF